MVTRTRVAQNFYKEENFKNGLYKFGSLVYPDDMDANNFYPDCIRFTIQKRTGVSIKDVSDSFKALGQAASTGWMGLVSDENMPSELTKTLRTIKADKSAPEQKEIKVEEAIAAYKIQNPDHPLPDSMFDIIKDSIRAATIVAQGGQKRALEMGKDSTNILGSIYLNMPNGIQFAEAANWAGTELGFLGKMTQNFVSGEGGGGDVAKALTGAAAGSAGNLIGATIGAIPSLVSKLGISGGMFGGAIGAMAAGTPIQKGIESALGVAQNPYMEMMFSGIGFRKFQFEFIIRPKSEKEVGVVADILEKFRTFTKPSYSEGKLGKAFMEYPMEFNIAFLTQGTWTNAKGVNNTKYQRNMNIPQLKNCVCDNVTSNFTPQSIWAAHAGGAPVAVNLSLSFQETELVMAEDVYRDGY